MVHTRILIKANDALKAVLMGMTVGMINIARWTLANDRLFPQFQLTLRPVFQMVFRGDRDFFAFSNAPIGDK